MLGKVDASRGFLKSGVLRGRSRASRELQGAPVRPPAGPESRSPSGVPPPAARGLVRRPDCRCLSSARGQRGSRLGGRCGAVGGQPLASGLRCPARGGSRGRWLSAVTPGHTEGAVCAEEVETFPENAVPTRPGPRNQDLGTRTQLACG